MINQLLLIGLLMFAVTCGVRATLGRLMARRSAVLAFVGSAVVGPLVLVALGALPVLFGPPSPGENPLLLFYGAAILAGLALPLCFLASALTAHWLRPLGRGKAGEAGEAGGGAP